MSAPEVIVIDTRTQPPAVIATAPKDGLATAREMFSDPHYAIYVVLDD